MIGGGRDRVKAFLIRTHCNPRTGGHGIGAFPFHLCGRAVWPPGGRSPVHTGAAYMGRIGIRAGQSREYGLSGPGYKPPVPWHGRGSHVKQYQARRAVYSGGRRPRHDRTAPGEYGPGGICTARKLVAGSRGLAVFSFPLFLPYSDIGPGAYAPRNRPPGGDLFRAAYARNTGKGKVNHE